MRLFYVCFVFIKIFSSYFFVSSQKIVILKKYNLSKAFGAVFMTRFFLKNIVLFVSLLMFAVACDDTVTYTEMKEKEVKSVKDFIKEKGIKTITFDEFAAKDSVTDLLLNEYVEIDGVYMQIVNNPENADDARKINIGDTRNILVRYYEYNIQDGDTITSNLYIADPDEMRVTNNSGTFSATFTSGIMKAVYGDNVPTGWLVPLNFLSFTRHQSQLAKVNLIVPHTKGTNNAVTYVYPCFYQVTFQPENLYDYEEGEETVDIVLE